MTGDVVLLEELSLNAKPALFTQLYDGWTLNFSNGHTNSANAVNALYRRFEGFSPRLPLKEKVEFCENIYIRRLLPPLFKITPASPPGLDEFLDNRGYRKVSPTILMAGVREVLSPRLSGCGSSARISSFIDNEWREAYFELNDIADIKRQRTAHKMFDAIWNPVFCARIYSDGAIIACGLCVTERGWAGLHKITVAAPHRRRGCGFELCGSLLRKAFEAGARNAYLQVLASNAPALGLYGKLGFTEAYPYWYRSKD